jgi:hypothetical protein
VTQRRTIYAEWGGVAELLAADERARDAIRATVRRQGERLAHVTPTAMIATLVTAACMPIVWPLLGHGVPASVEAAVDFNYAALQPDSTLGAYSNFASSSAYSATSNSATTNPITLASLAILLPIGCQATLL